jgi:hypothetical protein
MEYAEAPSIQYADRRLVFPTIKWLSKAKFEQLMKTNATIYPYISSIDGHGETNDDDENEPFPSLSMSNDRIYVGKSIQTHLAEGVPFNPTFRNENAFSLEIIGCVRKSDSSGQWQLVVPHSSTTFTIKNDFLVLSIEDTRSFQWRRTSKSEIPKYALRGCIDRLTNEYFYVGRTRPQDENNDENGPNYYRYGQSWVRFRERVPSLFGKVHVSHACMYAPYDNLELSFKHYDVLCLRPSPASLKQLCRCTLRELFQHSNEKIASINGSLPLNLVEFLKYPAFLSVGEYLVKGEKLVRDDGRFEMVIEPNDDLYIRPCVLSSSLTARQSASEQFDLETQQVKRLIHPRIDSIWLHRFHLVLYRKDGRLYVLHNFFNSSPPEYRFFINDQDPPNWSFKVMNQQQQQQ